MVPSKFFGALSMGRPVLFCGSPDSDIAYWINGIESDGSSSRRLQNASPLNWRGSLRIATS